MSVVEAMAAGAIPVVVRRGGLVEIVADGETGFLWDEPTELVRRTRELAAVAEPSLVALRGRAETAARRFSKQRFAAEVRTLARDLTGC
jgi:glycosyltransferase involved in cell wall biosynthesis